MGTPKWFGKNDTPRDKADKQERDAAKKYGGRKTIGSGNKIHDKADVHIKRGRIALDPKSIRLECKRTDAESISLKKEYIDKLIRETSAREFWALELMIQDRKVYVIDAGTFSFLQMMLTAPVEEIIESLGGKNVNVQG